MPVEDLLANPLNLRIHSQEQFDTLEGLLRDAVGVIQNVIFNTRTGHLIDGHARVALAQRRGESTLPVTLVDLDEPTEALALSTYDAVGALAENDPKQAYKLLMRAAMDDDYAARLVKSVYAPNVTKLAMAYVDPKMKSDLNWTSDTPVAEILERLRSALADLNDLVSDAVEDSVDDSDAFHHENSFTDKAKEWKDDKGEVSISHAMQVFVDNEEWPEIVAMLEKLAVQWEIDTQTDTVLECIRRSYHRNFGDEPAIDIPVLAE